MTTPTQRECRRASLAGAAWLTREETQAVFRALRSAGYEARAVGGAVRNSLLDEPVTDVDIATPARPQEVMAACTAAGLTCVPTGLDHGTITVIANHVPFEVTTLRQDVETFGRKANVAFTQDWTADAQRRDFTMNALYCTAEGDVLDPVCGYDDLIARHVRFIGEPAQRIREDYLRILRFFRFQAEYGRGAPDAAGLAACVRERHGLATLSAERIRAEVIRLLLAPRALAAVESMCDFGLLVPLLGLAPRPGVLAAMVRMEEALGLPGDAMLRLSALIVAVEEDVPAIAGRLRLSNAEREHLTVIDQRAGRMAKLDEQATRRLLYRLGPERWRRAALAAAVAENGSPGEPVWHDLVTLPQRWQVPALPVRGADVVALGISPGPAVGELLEQLEAWWIDHDFAPDEAALHQRLRQIVRQRIP